MGKISPKTLKQFHSAGKRSELQSSDLSAIEAVAPLTLLSSLDELNRCCVQYHPNLPRLRSASAFSAWNSTSGSSVVFVLTFISHGPEPYSAVWNTSFLEVTFFAYYRENQPNLRF